MSEPALQQVRRVTCLLKADLPSQRKIASACQRNSKSQKISRSKRSRAFGTTVQQMETNIVDETMSQFDKPFDPEKEEGTPARNLVPPGKYKAEVVDISLSKMKNGKGTLLNLSWQITEEGEWNARYVFQSMVHTHSESKDAEIW